MFKREKLGKQAMLPRKCNVCCRDSGFEYRLIECHDDPFSSLKTIMGRQSEEKSLREIRATAGSQLHFARESKEKAAIQRSRGGLKFWVALILLLLILACYLSYSVGYTAGSKVSYDYGYSNGYADGYFDGNFTGYGLGYDVGYGVGNSSGYVLGFEFGNITGYTSGYDQGYLKGVIDGAGTGFNIRDPTYKEMLDFIALDKTDENEYSESYTCIYFTRDVKNHAFDKGYRCGFVYIEFPNAAHAIVCFNTTDHGLVFIEPQYDDIVVLEIGRSYSALNGYIRPKYDDTIIRFTIIW